MLQSHPLTEIDTEAGPWVFDRTRRFGHRNRLNYQIVVNWVIAEHKSQGTMQLAMNRGQEEAFYLYTLNGPGAAARVDRWFAQLARPAFKSKVYGPSAGTNR